MTAIAARLSSITPWSSPPTMSSVGAATLPRAASPARSGRPPRDTTAPTRIAQPGRRLQRRAGAGRSAEQAERQARQPRVQIDPRHALRQPLGEQVDVEDVAALAGLALGQQIEQQGGEAAAVQVVGDRAVARTEPA